MIDCLIIGDSIAQGISNVRTECVSYAHAGWTSKQINQQYNSIRVNANTVIISLGTNDTKYVDTYKELIQIREHVKAKRVIWILPANINPNSGTDLGVVQSSVGSIATAYGDTILTIPRPMADRYHPTVKGYHQLAKESKR